MEDVSDLPFRLIYKEQGADIVYTEFANCEALIRNVKSQLRKLEVVDAERPVSIQIYGSMEESMEEAARMAEDAGADFVDINCGCWVKKVANRGDGAGLLRDLDKFRSVVAAVQRGTKLPVTVKTRLGWDEDNIRILEVARFLEDMGVAALTLHCRTRKQGHSGTADWSWLSRVKEVSSIPLIANGDIRTGQDAEQCFALGADGVMVARGAINCPWVFRQIKHYLATGEEMPDLLLEDKVAMCIRHLTESVEYHGKRAIFSFRKHYSGYLKGVRNIATLRKDLMALEEVEPIIERLNRFMAEYDDTAPDSQETAA
jgi:tRNA-dihydrouridine synthase B